MQDQRTADGNALALAAGKLMRPGILAIGKTDLAKQFQGFAFDFGLITLLHEQRRHHDVAKYGFVREQIVALEHHANMRAQFAGACRAPGLLAAGLPGFDDRAVQCDLTALNRLQSSDCAQQRGFAGTGRADHDQYTAFGNVEADVVKHTPVGIGVLLDQIAHRQCRTVIRFGNDISHLPTFSQVDGPRWKAASTQ